MQTGFRLLCHLNRPDTSTGAQVQDPGLLSVLRVNVYRSAMDFRSATGNKKHLMVDIQFIFFSLHAWISAGGVYEENVRGTSSLGYMYAPAL